MKHRIIFPIILFLTFLVWAPTLSTYFSQDDWVFLSHVYKQPFLAVFKHYSEAFYRPAGQQLFFFLGSNLFGLEAQGFHLLGLLIHLFNVWLLSRILNIFTHDRSVKYFLLIFYAVNPAHFVALNWLTQIDLEIAVSFGLLAVLFWKKTILSFIFFALGLFSHETIVMLPAAMALWVFKGPALLRQGRALLRSTGFLGFGVLVLIVKYLANPFSLQSDYSLNFNLPGFLATLKWYVLRALMIPEGIRSLPLWMIILSLIPGLILILMFRQKLARGLGIYLLGVLPVLGFGGHLLSAYAVFGVALMVIELGKNNVRTTKPLWMLSAAVIILSSGVFIYSNHLNHWSTGRGLVSARLTQNYTEADSDGKKQILAASADFANNSEIYFSTMFGKQFEVLDKGVSSGMFDVLFYRGNDLTTQFLPDAEFFRNSILAGKFPEWNPWIFAGMPYFLDPQNFLWYPPNYIFLLVPVETGFLILLIGHLLLAGWGIRRILGEFGVFGKLALLGAGMFALSPKLVGYIEEGNWTLVIAACWLPVLYFGLKKNKYWLTVLSLSAIVINNLNIGYYSILFVILFLLFLKRSDLAAARSDLKNQKKSLLVQVRRLLKILIAAVVLTVPRWLPLILYGGQTVRAGLNEAPLPLWSWVKVAKSLTLPLAAGHPVLQNEEILYLGLIPILFIFAYLVFKGPALPRQGRALLRKGDSLFWLIWLAFIFFVALNNKTPLFYLIKWLPGFSLLRITTRPWIFAALGLAVGAPITIRQIWPHTNLTSALGLRPSSRRAMVRGSDVPTDFLAKIRARPKNWGLLAESILVLLILSEFIWFDWKIFSRRKVVSDQAPARFYRQITTEGIPVRAYCTTGCLDRLTAQRMGIALLGGNNPIQLKSFVEYLQAAGGYRESAYHPILPPYTVFNRQPQPDANLLAKTATKFVVSPYELKDDKLELIDAERKYMLYKNKVVLDKYKEHYFD